MDGDYYLEPDFEPARLTKPQLRSILGEHGVANLPPANAKKDVLVELFVKHVQGKAEQIKKAKKSIRASSAGISMLDNQSAPSPSSSSKMRSPVRSRSKSPIKSSTAGKTRGRAKEIVEESTAKKSRSRSKSKVVPEPIDESNIFLVDTPVKALQTALPNRNDSPASATMKLQRRLGYIASTNNMALAEEAISPKYASPSTWPGLKKKSKITGVLGQYLFSAFKFIAALLFTIMVAMYLRWKYVYPFPYCDPNDPRPKLAFPEVDILTSLRNYCLTCPDHGVCLNGKLMCADGYVKNHGWFGFGETCVPDWKRFSKAEDLLKKMKTILREQLGFFQCQQCSTPTMSEKALKEVLKSQRFSRAPWYGTDFDSYYRLAMLDLLKDPKNHGIKVLGGSGEKEQKLLLSTIPTFTLKCQIYLLVRTYLWQISSTFAGIVLSILIFFKWKMSKWEHKKIEELVQTVLQCLAEQDALHRRDPSRPNTISVPQLRDALFMNASSSDKTKLWPKVCQAIAHNSNVRESVMSIKGEQHRVWEWIGMDVLAPFTKSY